MSIGCVLNSILDLNHSLRHHCCLVCLLCYPVWLVSSWSCQINTSRRWCRHGVSVLGGVVLFDQFLRYQCVDDATLCCRTILRCSASDGFACGFSHRFSYPTAQLTRKHSCGLTSSPVICSTLCDEPNSIEPDSWVSSQSRNDSSL